MIILEKIRNEVGRLKKKVKTKDEKDGKDDKIQIDFRKTYKDKNQFNELLLINAKNMKKNRKIKM